MYIFKWSTSFCYAEESPMAFVWVSLLYLPTHFINCNEALYSIANVFGKRLWVDQAMAGLSRPSMAIVLIGYNVSRLLLQ